MNKVISKLFGEKLKNGKIAIPNWAKRVKIDVGTSLNAPNSEVWLNNEDDCVVFGFEPNKYNVHALETGSNIGRHVRQLKLTPSRFNYSFFCFNCALSNYQAEEMDFYCAEDDSGTSSLFKPKEFEVAEITKVPVIKLADFFEIFPWETISHIEQLKIDAQSSDFNVIKGAGEYLSERVVYIDIETGTNGQYENQESPQELKEYIESQGFVCLSWGLDATFLNSRLMHLKDQIKHSRL